MDDWSICGPVGAGSPLSSEKDGDLGPLLPPRSGSLSPSASLYASAGPLSSLSLSHLALRLATCLSVSGYPVAPHTPGSDSGPPLSPSHLPLSLLPAPYSLGLSLPSLLVSVCLWITRSLPDSLSPSLWASICFSVSVLEAVSLICLSALSSLCLCGRLSLCDLSLILCLPPPLPAPPSPHPELSLGNRKFGGSERYQEAQLLPPKDNWWGGCLGWMWGEPRIRCVFLPALVHAETDRNYVTPLGLRLTLCGLGLMSPPPSRGSCEN